MSTTVHDVEIVEVDDQEAAVLFDKFCHAELGISGAVFMKGYRGGQYDDDDDPHVSAVLAYLPFAAGL